MKAAEFISSKIKFDGKASVIAIAVSFVIIIVSISVSGGFRDTIRNGVRSLSGDVSLVNIRAEEESSPIPANPSYTKELLEIDGVESMEPVIYRAGVLKTKDGIKAVIFKGTNERDSITLGIGIPSKLARELSISKGDKVLAYFVGEKVKARNFTVTDIWSAMIESEDALTIKASAEDLRRINGWNEGDASHLEIKLRDNLSSRERIEDKSREIANLIFTRTKDDEPSLYAISSPDKYPQLFDWLTLIRVNVIAILALMIVVAGFNMISGLLIMLFRNSSTIGVLKAMGMTDKGISEVFLRSASRAVLKGMAAGNIIGIAICLIQKFSGIIKLNPENYFVSFVPISMDWGTIILLDLASFGIIMLLLLIPSLFISKVDPAKSVRIQ